jgi:hypothetical protein
MNRQKPFLILVLLLPIVTFSQQTVILSSVDSFVTNSQIQKRLICFNQRIDKSLIQNSYSKQGQFLNGLQKTLATITNTTIGTIIKATSLKPINAKTTKTVKPKGLCGKQNT